MTSLCNFIDEEEGQGEGDELGEKNLASYLSLLNLKIEPKK